MIFRCQIESYSPISKFWGWKFCNSINIKSRLGGETRHLVRSTRHLILHIVSKLLNCLEFWNIEIFINYTFTIMCFNQNFYTTWWNFQKTCDSWWEITFATFDRGDLILKVQIGSYSQISKFWNWKFCNSINIKSRLGGATNRLVRSTRHLILHIVSKLLNCFEFWNIKIFINYILQLCVSIITFYPSIRILKMQGPRDQELPAQLLTEGIWFPMEESKVEKAFQIFWG